MSLGQFLLVLAATAGAAGTALAALRLARPDRVPPRVPQWTWLGAAGLAWLAFLWLLWQFIQVNVSLEYVFLYTSTAMPLRYRIAGTWTGMEGSLLLWSAFLAAATAVFLRPRIDAERERTWAGAFLGLIATAFLVAVAAQGTFRPTPDFFLQGRPGGNGLNPLLKSPFILIHPPVMFLAYALAAVPAATGLAHLATGTGQWSRLGASWSRLDWLVYTAAMGLGGIWAYYTLGFGGYWAWDPVEVANLLPWLALTAYLHAQLSHMRHGAFAHAGPFLALLPFILTVFSTISTRSGLWVSVHAFTDPTNTFNPDAASRFLDILRAEPFLGFFVAMSLTVFLLGLALWSRRLAAQTGRGHLVSRVTAATLAVAAAAVVIDPAWFLSLAFEASHLVSGGRTGFGLLGIVLGSVLASGAPLFLSEEEEARRGWLSWLNERTLVQASAVLLGLGTMVLFLFHMSAVDGWTRVFYDERFPWLVTPVLLLLMVFLLVAHHGRPRALIVTGLAWAAALLAAAASGATAYIATLSALLVAVAFNDLVRTATPRLDARQRLGAALLLAAGLLNVAFWINPPTVRLGFTSWQPVWPTQLLVGSVAVYALVQAHRLLAGRNVARPGHVYLLTALLGGYYLAPLFAVGAWALHRRGLPAVKPRVAAVRSRRLAVHGIHFVVALGVLAFTLSTYGEEEQNLTLVAGQTGVVGGTPLTYLHTEVEAEPGTPFAESFTPHFAIGESTTGTGYLYWEPQKDHYDPLPIATRLWTRDVYIDLVGVCIQDECQDSGAWIRQHGTSGVRALADVDVTAVEVRVLSLPGVGLVWTAWALGVTYGALLVTSQRRGGAP